MDARAIPSAVELQPGPTLSEVLASAFGIRVAVKGKPRGTRVRNDATLDCGPRAIVRAAGGGAAGATTAAARIVAAITDTSASALDDEQRARAVRLLVSLAEANASARGAAAAGLPAVVATLFDQAITGSVVAAGGGGGAADAGTDGTARARSRDLVAAAVARWSRVYGDEMPALAASRAYLAQRVRARLPSPADADAAVLGLARGGGSDDHGGGASAPSLASQLSTDTLAAQRREASALIAESDATLRQFDAAVSLLLGGRGGDADAGDSGSGRGAVDGDVDSEVDDYVLPRDAEQLPRDAEQEGRNGSGGQGEDEWEDVGDCAAVGGAATASAGTAVPAGAAVAGGGDVGASTALPDDVVFAGGPMSFNLRADLVIPVTDDTEPLLASLHDCVATATRRLLPALRATASRGGTYAAAASSRAAALDAAVGHAATMGVTARRPAGPTPLDAAAPAEDGAPLEAAAFSTSGAAGGAAAIAPWDGVSPLARPPQRAGCAVPAAATRGATAAGRGRGARRAGRSPTSADAGGPRGRAVAGSRVEGVANAAAAAGAARGGGRVAGAAPAAIVALGAAPHAAVDGATAAERLRAGIAARKRARPGAGSYS